MEVVATAGHVDHGKSTLLRALTAMEPDRFAEEHRRGLTIDLGYVWADLPTPGGEPVTVAFVDVPGHEDFLRNMLSGVGAVGEVLLVVAADDGLQAQSEEHLQIVELLGLRVALAVVSKADLAGDERTRATMDEVGARLAAGGHDAVPVVAADARTGAGVAEVGATLAERLAARPRPDPGDAPWLWVDRAFTVRGAGTVATGTLVAGRLRPGDALALLPDGAVGRIRGLQTLGRDAAEVVAPARAAVNLGRIDRDRLRRGGALVGVADGAPTGLATTRLDVALRTLPHARVGARGAWHLHLGTAVATARVRPLLTDLEPGTGAPVRLELAEALPARIGERFVLRDAGRASTAGGGVVLDPAPRDRPRGTERRLAHALVLEELAAATSPGERVGALVDAHGGVRDVAGLRAALGGAAAGGDLGAPAGLGELAGHLVRPERLERWLEAVGDAAARGDPEHALAVSEITAAVVDAGCPPALVDGVVDRAVADDRVRRHGGRVVASAHEPAYLAARDRRQRALVDALAAAPLDPPDPARTAEELGVPWFEVRALVDEGALVACGELLFTADAVAEAVRHLREGPGAGGAAFTAAEARSAWGNTRRCALPLLEHLRAVRLTRFDGQHHRLTGRAAAG